MSNKSVVIVAGGSGNRMKSQIPKQFLNLKNTPVIVHTIQKFILFDSDIQLIVVLPEGQIDYFKKLTNPFNLPQMIITAGGKTRFQSVKNGIKHVTGETVAIHDAVRPLVSIKTISRCFESALKKDSGVPVIEAVDSIRQVEQADSKALDRSSLRYVQTPQVFKSEKIIQAVCCKEKSFFTDDATVFEYSGNRVHLVEGNIENIKITHPIDLKVAEYYLEQ